MRRGTQASRLCTHKLLALCRDDLVNMQLEALKNPEFRGVYNATAPNPVRMSELCASLGSVLGRPSWLPVPEFAIQARPTAAASVCTTVPPRNQRIRSVVSAAQSEASLPFN